MEIGTRVRAFSKNKTKGTVVKITENGNVGIEWDNGLYTFGFDEFMIDCYLQFPEEDLCHGCKDELWCCPLLRRRLKNVNP